MENQKLYSVDEAAVLIGCSIASLYLLIRTDEVKTVKKKRGTQLVSYLTSEEIERQKRIWQSKKK